MARTLIVSDRHNSFFTANNIRVGNQLPTEGNYVKGDIIVNIGESTATEAMWICVESGNPGVWEVVGAGAGGNGGSNFISINDSVFVNEPVNEVSLAGLGVGVSSKDKLIVHHNSVHLMEGVDYEISKDGTKIVKLTEGNWNEDSEENALFAFELFKGVESVEGDKIVVDSKLTSITNHVILKSGVSEVEIGIDGFNAGNDMMLVFKNGVNMVEGVDYEVQGGKIVSTGEVWNENGIEDYGMTFVVFKEVVVYNGDAEVKAENIADGSIGMDKLADDVKEAIEEASNIDLSGYVEQEEYNGKIAELEGKVNEAFTSANNGKQLIANAIGEPVSADDTFSAMSNDINILLSTFKTNMMNNGITVDSGDKFKQLIDKIATMIEEGEGKGIQYATGDITGFNMEYNQTKNTTININFKPSFVFIEFEDKFKNTNGSSFTLSPMVMSSTRSLVVSLTSSGAVAYYMSFNINNITEESFNFVASTMYSIPSYTMVIPNAKWYAIGVGEEDTTLRDSLASILEGKGVEVTEEDDMADLITKVDEEFTKLETTTMLSPRDIKQVACGYRYTLVVKNDGSLWATGNNNYGQLGLGDTTARTTFTKVTTNINNDVKQIACGENHTFILKNDGSLWACGYNNYGQLGNGGNNTLKTFTKITNNINNDVKEVICGRGHTYIIKNDGTVWSTGKNTAGELGLNNTTNKNLFTQVTTNVSDVKQIACGYYHTYLLTNDGTVYACGDNSKGQLGLGNTTQKNIFTTVNITNVKQISCHNYQSMLVKNDGTLWACGDNTVGQLGFGRYEGTYNSFTQVTANINNDVKQIACGYGHTFILKNDGSIWSTGYNDYGQLSLGDTANRPSFNEITSYTNNDIKQIYCGDNHTFVLTNDGSVWCCGYNEYGQLGLNDVAIRNVLTRSFMKLTTGMIIFE